MNQRIIDMFDVEQYITKENDDTFYSFFRIVRLSTLYF